MAGITWEHLYNMAKEKLNPRIISPFIKSGDVSACILTKSGKVFTGVCIDAACGLGMCAEQNAIANMITNDESQIVKLVCVMSDGSVVKPCGACREYLMQLDKNSSDIEILTDYETKEIVKLKELLPGWWGNKAYV
ncbi:MAG: cytidine deaminase [Clostridia bacterium]|jgi:homotetrameric cytidine deaminase